MGTRTLVTKSETAGKSAKSFFYGISARTPFVRLVKGLKLRHIRWMSDAPVIKHKIIYIRTLAHKSGGLYMAMSDDLPGLSIAGLSTEEIEGKLEGAIRDFLEMSGCEVISIELSRDARFAMPDFGPPAFIADASLSANHVT